MAEPGPTPAGAVGNDGPPPGLRALAELELRRAVAAAANLADQPEEALSVALEALCDFTGWEVGHVYLATADGHLVSTSRWHFARGAHQAIRESLRYGSFDPRLSPPGTVLRSGIPMWLGDSSQAVGFAAAATARGHGLAGWAGYPIGGGDGCVGVIEFYATIPADPDPQLDGLMREVGDQLQRVVQRRREADDRTEVLLRQQFMTAWFRSLLQSTDEGICGLDLDGRVSFVNAAGAEMLGHTPDAMQGEVLHDLCHHTRPDGSKYPKAECPILRSSRTGEGVRVDIEVFWRKGGTSFPVEYSSHAIVDLGGDIKGTVLTFTDITARRLEEQAIRDLNQDLLHTRDELQRANLLKSDFLATMSHELRTPLNAIMGFAGLLQGGLAGDLSETAVDYLERINRNAQGLLALINDVLDLSKIEARRMPLGPRVIDAVAIVRQATENMTSLAEARGLSLELLDRSGDPRALAQPRAVHQVVTNLLSNAIKFTDGGGVRVEVEDDGVVLVTRVSDTGLGIAAEEQTVIFEAFRQVGAHARTGTGGTGLGLAISQRLAQEMGGDLSVSSIPGEGSTFTFTLPSARASEGYGERPGGAPRPLVLWVTTNVDHLEAAGGWLRALGLEFVALAAPGVVVRAAAELAPALVLLDLPAVTVDEMLEELMTEPGLESLPLLVVVEPRSVPAHSRPGMTLVERPLGREELFSALQALRHRPDRVAG